MNKYILLLSVFIAGAVIMIFEIAGSRVLAPFLGTSLVTWTSLIGIILGSLSLGYWWGGRIADKNPRISIFAWLFLGAAVFVCLTAAWHIIILQFIQSRVNDLRLGGIIAILFLFAPASIFLGMVSPYAVKLKLKTMDKSGATVGNLFAVSTIGSIVGTFSAGFFLIPLLGTTKILYCLSAVLILTAIIAGGRHIIKLKSAALLIALLLLAGFSGLAALWNQKFNREFSLVDIDTLYNRIFIFDGIDHRTQRPARYLITDPYGIQSAVFLDGTEDLVFNYGKFYRLAEHFNHNFKKSLLIGGGAYTYPGYYARNYPNATLDVVELDPELVEIARQYFNYKDSPGITIHHQGGRAFLNANKNIYDCIFVDAFTSRMSIPFQLTTKETIEKIYRALADKGVVLVNLVSAISGEKGKFLRAEYATYKTIFPQVYIFPTKDKAGGLKPQNIILAALKSEQKPNFVSNSKELNNYLEHLWTKEIAVDVPVLTDDYAPVDYYAMKMF